MSLSFSFADFLIVAVILISTGYAVWRGFLAETLSVFEWVAAAFACLYLGPYFIPLTHSLVAAWWLANLLAYAGVFLAVFIPLAFMSHRFAQSVKNSPIGPLDRALAVAFGVVRGMVVIGMAYLAFTYFVPIRQQPRWVTQARLLPAVQATSEVMLSLVPGQPHNVAAIQPRTETVRQEPAARQTRHSDPLADIIRRNAATDSASPAAMQQQGTQKGAKRYGAQDRQALDKLIEATGNGK